MIALKSAAIVLLTLAIEFMIQRSLPVYGSDPLISSLAQIVLRSGLGIAFAISWGRYLGMWRRVSGRSGPWAIAAGLVGPGVIVAVMLSSEAELLARSLGLQVLCAMIWVAIAWSARDVGAALDEHYAARRSPVARLDRLATGLPDRVGRRGEMVGLDAAQIALSAFVWYAMKAALSLG